MPTFEQYPKIYVVLVCLLLYAVVTVRTYALETAAILFLGRRDCGSGLGSETAAQNGFTSG